MDPETALATYVWRFMTIREIGCLMQVSHSIRDQLVSNHLFINRMSKFLNKGLSVIQYCMAHMGEKNFDLEQDFKRLKKQISLLENHQPLIVFPMYQ